MSKAYDYIGKELILCELIDELTEKFTSVDSSDVEDCRVIIVVDRMENFSFEIEYVDDIDEEDYLCSLVEIVDVKKNF